MLKIHIQLSLTAALLVPLPYYPVPAMYAFQNTFNKKS